MPQNTISHQLKYHTRPKPWVIAVDFNILWIWGSTVLGATTPKLNRSEFLTLF
jgi:hypothetical protein